MYSEEMREGDAEKASMLDAGFDNETEIVVPSLLHGGRNFASSSSQLPSVPLFDEKSTFTDMEMQQGVDLQEPVDAFYVAGDDFAALNLKTEDLNTIDSAPAAAVMEATLANPPVGMPTVKSRRRKLTPEERERRKRERSEARRMRKSVREKERRLYENELFEQLADLCKLPRDKREKASVLSAVIQTLSGEYADCDTSAALRELSKNYL